jgi:hypothetical protein
VTVHDPICTESGNLEAALYGSFLPIPPEKAFPDIDPADYAHEKVPGAIIAKKERIVINRGRERIRLRVTNNGDRPIQVRHHSIIIIFAEYLGRLDPITTLSKRTPLCHSIAPKLMGSGSTSPLEQPFVSNQAMSKR